MSAATGTSFAPTSAIPGPSNLQAAIVVVMSRLFGLSDLDIYERELSSSGQILGSCGSSNPDSQTSAIASNSADADAEAKLGGNKGADKVDNVTATSTVATSDVKSDSDDSTKADTVNNANAADTAAAAAKPRYILHSDHFYLRKRPFLMQWEQAYLLGQQLPSVPRHRPC
ncbi:hypothetical protein H4R24_004719 [Coemansia sp. RSA 988]|nr:hypothetical protein H4R24_004719 [Coemansia sp. RSA 988]